MARFSTLILSALLSTLAACSNTDPKTGNIAANDTAAYNNNEQVPNVFESDDTEVEEVPAADEDSAAEEPVVCEFEVDTPNSVVIMNELVVSFSESNPTDGTTTDPGMNQVLDLDLTVVHEDCPALIISTIQVRAWYTDVTDSDWSPSNFQVTNMSSEEAAYPVAASSVAEIDVYSFAYFDGANFEIAGGETITLTFAADSTGASSEEDDMMRVDLPEGGIGVSDGTNLAFVHNPEIQGSTLVF